MSMPRALTLALVGASCAACKAVVAFGDECSHTAPRETTLATAGATRVVIDAGAGGRVRIDDGSGGVDFDRIDGRVSIDDD